MKKGNTTNTEITLHVVVRIRWTHSCLCHTLLVVRCQSQRFFNLFHPYLERKCHTSCSPPCICLSSAADSPKGLLCCRSHSSSSQTRVRVFGRHRRRIRVKKRSEENISKDFNIKKISSRHPLARFVPAFSWPRIGFAMFTLRI